MMEVWAEGELGRAVSGRVGTWQVLSDGESGGVCCGLNSFGVSVSPLFFD